MKTGKHLLVAMLCCLLLAGCSTQQASAAPRKVVLVAKSTETEFWKSVLAGSTAAASEYNIDLWVVGPETEEDFEAQNDFIDQAVADGAEVIIFSAISYDGNAAAVDRAVEAGVHVVVIDSDVHSDQVAVRIGTDNVDAGRKAGEAALDTELETLIVGLINYDPGSRNGQEREAGTREILNLDPRVVEIHTINVLTEQEDAREKTQQLLQENPQINIVIAFNEPTSVGAALALDEMGLKGSVHMVGFDSNVRTVDMMHSGVVSALIVQNPYAMGYLGVEASYNILSGKSYDPTVLIDTSTIIVSEQNMFITEGQRALFPFH